MWRTIAIISCLAGISVISCMLIAPDAPVQVSSIAKASAAKLGPDHWSTIVGGMTMVVITLVGYWTRRPASKVYDDLNNKHPDSPGTGDLIRQTSASMIVMAASLAAIRDTQAKHDVAIEEVAKIATRNQKTQAANQKRMDGMVTLIEKVGECRAPQQD